MELSARHVSKENTHLSEDDNDNGETDDKTSIMNGHSEHISETRNEKDIDDVLSNLKFGLFNIKMLVLFGGAYFAICAEMMVIVFLSKPVKELWNINHMVYAWLPVATRIGSIIGCFSFGTLSDHFGRRFPFLIAIITTALFGIISAFATNFIFLVILRALVSVGTGGIEATNFVLMLGKKLCVDHCSIE